MEIDWAKLNEKLELAKGFTEECAKDPDTVNAAIRGLASAILLLAHTIEAQILREIKHHA